MNVIAFSMFISLILVLANNLDPRSSTSDRASGLVKLAAGIVLGFVIILLYGIGVPGLRYMFLVIGVGGIVHLLVSETIMRTYNLTS